MLECARVLQPCAVDKIGKFSKIQKRKPKIVSLSTGFRFFEKKIGWSWARVLLQCAIEKIRYFEKNQEWQPKILFLSVITNYEFFFNLCDSYIIYNYNKNEVNNVKNMHDFYI